MEPRELFPRIHIRKIVVVNTDIDEPLADIGPRVLRPTANQCLDVRLSLPTHSKDKLKYLRFHG